MMVEINNLAEHMFCYGKNPLYLDRTTGEVIAADAALAWNEGRYLPLPRYSVASLRQQFMREMHEKGILSDANMTLFARFPDFPLEYDEALSAAIVDYVCRAHQFCELMRLESTEYDLPDQVRTAETYDEFEERRSIELAREWCQKHGLRFYNFFDIPRSEKDQLEAETRERESWQEWYKRPSARRLYEPETFARIIDEKVRKMHEDWRQKREAYARAVERGEMPDGDKGGA